MYVSWSSVVVRFSEKLQIIDLQDCLSCIYETHGSAKAAQAKFFGTELANTEKTVECDAGKLMMKVKWSDAARSRSAVGVSFMQKFCDKICKMPRASYMASKLDVETLTVRSACQEDMDEAAADGNDGDKDAGRIVVTDAVFKLADPRVAAQAATQRLSADVAESLARKGKADHQSRMDDIEFQEKRALAVRRWYVEDKKAKQQEEFNDEAHKMNLLKKRMEVAESVGMHDKSNALKRKLEEMLSAECT